MCTLCVPTSVLLHYYQVPVSASTQELCNIIMQYYVIWCNIMLCYAILRCCISLPLSESLCVHDIHNITISSLLKQDTWEVIPCVCKSCTCSANNLMLRAHIPMLKQLYQNIEQSSNHFVMIVLTKILYLIWYL